MELYRLVRIVSERLNVKLGIELGKGTPEIGIKVQIVEKYLNTGSGHGRGRSSGAQPGRLATESVPVCRRRGHWFVGRYCKQLQFSERSTAKGRLSPQRN
jgi:hypothetical protein